MGSIEPSDPKMDLSIMPRWASWDKGKMANCERWASYRRNLALCQGGEEEIDLMLVPKRSNRCLPEHCANPSVSVLR